MIRKSKYSRAVVVMDVDGVVADFCFSMTQILKELFGKPEYPIGNFQAEAWGIEWLGLKKEDEDVFWAYLRNSDEPFWESEREMVPGLLKKAYEKFRGVDGNRDFVWYFCTTRDDCKAGSAQWQTRRFLERNGFYDSNVVVSDKKGEFCLSVNADYFIDDKFTNCEEVRTKSPNTKVYFLMLQGQSKHKGKALELGMEIVTSTQDFLNALPVVED